MRKQHRIEAALTRVRGVEERFWDVGPEPSLTCDGDGVLVVVHAHSVGIEVLEVATDSAADVEHTSEPQTAEVPPVGACTLSGRFQDDDSRRKSRAA